MATTSVGQVQKADWAGLERDVVVRIRVLRAVAVRLRPGPIGDAMARDLILPAAGLLARFCACVAVDGRPDQAAGGNGETGEKGVEP